MILVEKESNGYYWARYLKFLNLNILIHQMGKIVAATHFFLRLNAILSKIFGRALFCCQWYIFSCYELIFWVLLITCMKKHQTQSELSYWSTFRHFEGKAGKVFLGVAYPYWARQQSCLGMAIPLFSRLAVLHHF